MKRCYLSRALEYLPVSEETSGVFTVRYDRQTRRGNGGLSFALLGIVGLACPR